MLHNFLSNAISISPKLLKKPISLTPFFIKGNLIKMLINYQLDKEIKSGNLNFLENKYLEINVIDLDLTWYVTFQNNELDVLEFAPFDVSFSGFSKDLILISAQCEDPDTLFFQRRLKIEGDVDLGLKIKNLLSSIDLNDYPEAFKFTILNLSHLIKKYETNI